MITVIGYCYHLVIVIIWLLLSFGYCYLLRSDHIVLICTVCTDDAKTFNFQMNVKLKNRHAVRGEFSQFVDDMVVPEEMIMYVHWLMLSAV